MLRCKPGVYHCSQDKRILTAGGIPHKDGSLVSLFLVIALEADNVIVLEKACKESPCFIAYSIEKVCFCLRHLLILSLNLQIIELQRLGKRSIKPVTKRCDIVLEVKEVRGYLVLIPCHSFNKVAYSIESNYMLTGCSGKLNQRFINIIELQRAGSQIGDDIGYKSGKSIVTVYIRNSTGYRKYRLIRIIESCNNVSYTVNILAHITEYNLKLYRIPALFKVKQVIHTFSGFRIDAAEQLILERSIVIELQVARFPERYLSVNTNSPGYEHTRHCVLSEPRHNIVKAAFLDIHPVLHILSDNAGVRYIVEKIRRM